MDELQHLAEDAKRELEPHNRQFDERQIKQEKKRLDNPEEGERMTRLEYDSVEHQDRIKKLTELRKKEYKAGIARTCTKEEVEFIEEVYDAARLDNFRETIKRSVLIQIA